jgi:hypothetical protein
MVIPNAAFVRLDADAAAQETYRTLETTNFRLENAAFLLKLTDKPKEQNSLEGSERASTATESENSDALESIPSVRVSGSHYEIGHGIGRRFKEMIRSRFEKDEKLRDILLPYAATEDGRAAVEQLSRENR